MEGKKGEVKNNNMEAASKGVVTRNLKIKNIWKRACKIATWCVSVGADDMSVCICVWQLEAIGWQWGEKHDGAQGVRLKRGEMDKAAVTRKQVFMCGSKTTLDLSISAFIYLILLSVTMSVPPTAVWNVTGQLTCTGCRVREMSSIVKAADLFDYMRVRYIKCQDASRVQAMLHVACGQNYKIIRH